MSKFGTFSGNWLFYRKWKFSRGHISTTEKDRTKINRVSESPGSVAAIMRFRFSEKNDPVSFWGYSRIFFEASEKYSGILSFGALEWVPRSRKSTWSTLSCFIGFRLLTYETRTRFIISTTLKNNEWKRIYDNFFFEIYRFLSDIYCSVTSTDAYGTTVRLK